MTVPDCDKALFGEFKLTTEKSADIITKYKGIEEKSRLFALVQRTQKGENEESYIIIENGLGAAYRE